MIFEIDGVIKEKAELQDGIFYLSVEAPSIAYLAGPGQFVLVRVSPSFDPFLRRPLSIAGTKDDRIKLLFSIVGRGTSLLSRMREGDVLSLRGPLGKSFPHPEGDLLLVGGGMGVAPLLFAHQVYGGRLVLGVKDGSWKGLCDWVRDSLKGEVSLFSEDGSIGEKGTALDGALYYSYPSSEVWACGPKEMLFALYRALKGKVKGIFGSIEERMACGIGGCYGCSMETPRGMRRVCVDGPVFDLKEVCEI